MIILGIDPGFAITGYSVIQASASGVQLVDYGMLRLAKEKDLPTKTEKFYLFFKDKIATWQPTSLAIETPFLGPNAQNFMKLGYLRGIVYLLASQHKLVLQEFAPREVKVAITGYGAASKEQVSLVLQRLFHGLEEPKKLDVTDALAVTLCAAWHTKNKAQVFRD